MKPDKLFPVSQMDSHNGWFEGRINVEENIVLVWAHPH